MYQARPNIKIFQNALTKKILSDEHKRATAVTIDSGHNLEDHVMYRPSHRVQLDTIHTETYDPTTIMLNLVEYFTKARVPFAYTGMDYAAWEKIPQNVLSKKATTALPQRGTYPTPFPRC